MSLPDEARFSYLLKLPEGANLAKAINEAMKAIERENEELKDVLPKTYALLDNSTIVELMKALASVPMDIEGDAFGKIYEYFLGKFAMSEGQKGGEFFTPTAIVKLIVEVIEPFHRQDVRQGQQALEAVHGRFGNESDNSIRKRSSSADRNHRLYGSSRYGCCGFILTK